MYKGPFFVFYCIIIRFDLIHHTFFNVVASFKQLNICHSFESVVFYLFRAQVNPARFLISQSHLRLGLPFGLSLLCYSCGQSIVCSFRQGSIAILVFYFGGLQLLSESLAFPLESLMIFLSYTSVCQVWYESSCLEVQWHLQFHLPNVIRANLKRLLISWGRDPERWTGMSILLLFSLSCCLFISTSCWYSSMLCIILQGRQQCSERGGAVAVTPFLDQDSILIFTMFILIDRDVNFISESKDPELCYQFFQKRDVGNIFARFTPVSSQ